mgnify:CR=1 FL=1
MRQASAMLHQSPYVNQLVCAVGGVLVFIAKSEWRGGEQKKWKKWNLTCLVLLLHLSLLSISRFLAIADIVKKTAPIIRAV